MYLCGDIISDTIKGIEKHFPGFAYVISVEVESNEVFMNCSIIPSMMCLDLEFRTFVMNYHKLNQTQKESFPQIYFEEKINLTSMSTDDLELVFKRAISHFENIRRIDDFKKLIKNNFQWGYLLSYPLKHTSEQFKNIHYLIDEFSDKVRYLIKEFNVSRPSTLSKIRFESFIIRQSLNKVSAQIFLNIPDNINDTGIISIGCDYDDDLNLSDSMIKSSIDELLLQVLAHVDFLTRNTYVMTPRPELKVV